MKPDKGHPAWLHKAMADGGSAWQGEGDSGKALKEKAAESRANAESNRSDSRKLAATSGATAGLGLAGILGARSLPGKAIGAGLTAIGGNAIKNAFRANTKADQDRDDANEANRAADKAEGRKRGGKVKGKK